MIVKYCDGELSLRYDEHGSAIGRGESTGDEKVERKGW